MTESDATAREIVFWALWDNYSADFKNEIIDALIAEHSASVKAADPEPCPCCGRETHYCG